MPQQGLQGRCVLGGVGLDNVIGLPACSIMEHCDRSLRRDKLDDQIAPECMSDIDFHFDISQWSGGADVQSTLNSALPVVGNDHARAFFDPDWLFSE